MRKVIIFKKIKAYRRAHGLTQGQFGDLLGVSAQAVSKWEREECHPDIIFLPELARVLECSVDDLFAEDAI